MPKQVAQDQCVTYTKQAYSLQTKGENRIYSKFSHQLEKVVESKDIQNLATS